MRLESQMKVVQEYRYRFVWLVIAVVSVFTILITRLAYLQLSHGEEYLMLSEHNFVQERVVPTLRGRISDREDRTLAENRPAYNVYLTPAFITDMEATLVKLEGYLNLSEEQSMRLLRAFEKAKGLRRFREIQVETDITRDQLALFESHKLQLAGVTVRPGPRRYYNHGPLLAHLIGYVGRINERELAGSTGYMASDHIGKMGMEKAFELDLHGQHGLQRVVVDAQGRAKGPRESEVLIREETDIAPVVGRGLSLSIDLDLQKAAEKHFVGKAGAVVVLDVQTGFIRAWVSKPAFDPNKFVGGISHMDWESYRNSILDPMMDKVNQAAYFPGSTYKVIPAIAALESGEFSISDINSCPGFLNLGKHRFNCWKHYGHGYVDIRRAIKESCDVYFYSVAEKLGLDPIRQWAARFGLGEKPGTGINNETAGLLPSQEWHEKIHQRRWFTGDSLSHAIGQGDLMVSPLQLAVLYSALVNGGKIWTPQVVLRMEEPDGSVYKSYEPRLKSTITVSQEVLEVVREALCAVVNEKGGTAYASRLLEPKFCGKTGTAQVVKLPKDKRAYDDYLLKDHAWFVGYAPSENPRIVVVAMTEHGEHGSWVAPVVREMVAAWYEKETGKPAERPRYSWQSPLAEQAAMR